MHYFAVCEISNCAQVFSTAADWVQLMYLCPWYQKLTQSTESWNATCNVALLPPLLCINCPQHTPAFSVLGLSFPLYQQI